MPQNQEANQNNNNQGLSERESQSPLSPENQEQGRDVPYHGTLKDFQNDSSHETYSNKGPRGAYDEQTLPNDDDPFADTEQDQYGDQDVFGDIDGNDPYSNLYDNDAGSTENTDEAGLYGLAEPLAKEGDESNAGSERDSHGTRISQDQSGYQQ